MKNIKSHPHKRHEVIQPLDTSYRLIPLTQNQTAIVDVSDYEYLNQWNWHAQYSKAVKGFYAVRWMEGGGTLQMSRAILGLQYGNPTEADHRSGNTLDNRRDNLRPTASFGSDKPWPTCPPFSGLNHH
jgi:hypothetical protein